MINLDSIRKLVNGFPEVTEAPHFEKTSFRVKKKIFATYDHVHKNLCLKLSPGDQDLFSLAGKPAIYPVKNAWGKSGWTMIELNGVKKNLVIDALVTAYCTVAPPALAEKIRLSYS